MALLIDSGVFIDLERRGLRSDQALAMLAAEPIAISSMTASEMLFGVHRADTAQRALRRQAFVEPILQTVKVLPFDLGVARVHADLSEQLVGAGATIGDRDLIIAATAVAHKYELLILNPKEFRRVPGRAVREPSWV